MGLMYFIDLIHDHCTLPVVVLCIPIKIVEICMNIHVSRLAYYVYPLVINKENNRSSINV